MKKWVKGLLVSGLALSLIPAVNQTADSVGAQENTPASKNLIVLIGDGMGPAQVTAGRMYQHYFHQKPYLALDEIFVGNSTTFADASESGGNTVSGLVTDSASSGTAFATGNKTYNGAISVSNEEVAKPYASIIEAAEEEGKATGIVSTARITHATPAVYASHVRSRGNENAIAAQYADSGVDVLFGGGERQFKTSEEGGKRSDKNLIPEFESKGYEIVRGRSELMALEGSEEKVLGFFGHSHMDYTLDRDADVPSLAELTDTAIDILSRDEDGFVMMIEAGRIDHAGHANDFPGMVQEMLDFDAAVKVALDFAKEDGETSVVITADHETGGLSLSRDNIYELNIAMWDDARQSSEVVGKALNGAETAADIRKIVADNMGITDLSNVEVQFIMDGDGTSYGREGGYNAVISKRLLVGWSGHGHSGVDVGVWAYGPIADLVRGQIDNTDIAKSGAEVLGLDLDAATRKLQQKYMYPKFKMNRTNEVLYPARALAEALDIELGFDAEEKTVSLMKEDQMLRVEIETLQVGANEQREAWTAELDRGTLYLSIEAFNLLSGMEMKWDALSERLLIDAVGE
ncbi:alkaline phosphatase [Marinicrinis sediminis]|uniref:Alkaline phosphatase n=1 Tax=Marinicrinis sediminis TaxID=1652465 RepID=A0ABW5RDC0_9BACL